MKRSRSSSDDEPEPKRQEFEIVKRALDAVELKSEAKQYPDTLVEFLKPLSGECPCGHKHIRYECHVRNNTTGRTAFVGTECIKWFPDGERMESVIKIAHSLMSTGLEGTYKVRARFGYGCWKTTFCGQGLNKNDKWTFAIHANAKLVMDRSLFQWLALREYEVVWLDDSQPAIRFARDPD